MESRKAKAAAWLLLGLACLSGGAGSPAQGESSESVIQLVEDLLLDASPVLRAEGLQQVRVGAPGEAATKRFADLLSELPPQRRAELLGALGDRGDPAARPAVLRLLNDEQEAVRAAALEALGALGSSADVAILATEAARDSELESTGARRGLIRLRGDDVNQKIVSVLVDGNPEIRAVLLGVLADRGAKETLPTVIACAEDPELPVRLAALEVIRFLAEADDTAEIVKLLNRAQDDQQRRMTELALLRVCNLGREACVDSILAGLAEADVPAQVALLHALARAGGPRALEGIASRLEDQDEAVRDEAVRMLSIWPDTTAVDHLRALAQKGGTENDGKGASLRHHVLAIRGLVRLASPQAWVPANLKLLAEAMDLATRPQEKRLVLGVLGETASAEALAIVMPTMDQPELAEEAALAAVMISERIVDSGGDRDPLRTAMAEVLQVAKSPQIRQRAQKICDLE